MPMIVWGTLTVMMLTYLSTLRLCASILQSLPRALGGSKHRHSCFRSERCNLANAKKKFYAFMYYIILLDMQISNTISYK